MKRLFGRLFALPFRTRDTIARDVDEELDFHIDMKAREYEAGGLRPEEARARARAEFGDIESTRQFINETDRRVELGQRLGTWLAEGAQDLRQALRQSLRQPAATILAAGTLAIGIGASTAIYSVVHGVLFAPLLFPDQDRVVVLRQFDGAAGVPVHLAPQNFIDWKDQSSAFAHMAIAEPYGMTMTGEGTPTRFDAWRVTPGFFDALGVPALLGRTFTAAEHESGAGGFVVLSHRAWRGRFAGGADVIGRTITLDEQPHTIIGVMGPRFIHPTATDIYVARPLIYPQDGRQASRVATYLRGIGRLAPAATLDRARAEAARVATELQRVDPGANRQTTLLVTPVHEYLTAPVKTLLLVLLGAVLLVQLIASANVGALLLARGVNRRRELAVRAALGAGRGRLARQLLAEAAVLSLLALAAGLGLGAVGVKLLRYLAPTDLPRLDDIVLGVPVMVFAAGLAAFTVLAAGLMPALEQARADAGLTLRDGASALGRRRLPRAFVAVEVALTLMLLVGAGLLLRSHARLLREDLGFDPHHTLAMTLHVWGEYPDPVQRNRFFDELLDRLRAIPGVTAAAGANALPLSIQGSEMDPPYLVEGQAVPERGNEPTAILTIVTPDYFDAMRIRLVRGRGFSPRDDAATMPVVIINEALARRHFEGVDPVGRRLTTIYRGRTVHEIVGVAADVRHERLDEVPRPEIYVPLAQRSFGSMTLLVRSQDTPAPGLPQAVQAALWEQRAGLVFDNVERLDVRLRETLAPRRFALALVGLFALVALLLALVGIYGAISFAVSQRTAEIGVRMALGARAAGVVGMLVSEGIGVVAVGTLAGVAGAVALTRLMRGLLFGVSPFDPLTYALIAALMLGTAALAAWIPARRAARVDPVTAIRG